MTMGPITGTTWTKNRTGESTRHNSIDQGGGTTHAADAPEFREAIILREAEPLVGHSAHAHGRTEAVLSHRVREHPIDDMADPARTHVYFSSGCVRDRLVREN